jgi:hypothetical protein
MGLASSRPLPAAVVDAIPASLSPAAKKKLMGSGSYRFFFQEQPDADLWPDPAARADLLDRLDASHPNIGVQTLVVAALPAGPAARTDLNLVRYNLIHQFRSMAGIPDDSASHGDAGKVVLAEETGLLGPASLLGGELQAGVEARQNFQVDPVLSRPAGRKGLEPMVRALL